MDKKIMVYGMGYVGLSNSLLLSQNNDVVGIEIVPAKVEMLNQGKSPIVDEKISEFLARDDIRFFAKPEDEEFLKVADYAIIATPTNFDEEKNFFDTSSVESVIENVLKVNPEITIVVKSTIPIGFMDNMTEKYPEANLLFSPEFLREGKALQDNLEPSRIIVGCKKDDETLKAKAEEFTELLAEGATKEDIPTFVMGYNEAESVKLFANTYLAMRVAYINELDNFAQEHGFETKDIINGICADPRIGNFYNNPSFGYGGYCFPKDTKQLFANYKDIPNNLIRATVESNDTRKEYIANYLVNHTKDGDEVGFYRLVMKSGSDNCRASAIIDVIKKVAKKRTVLIYEPTIEKFDCENCIVMNDLENFKKISDLIVTNRVGKDLSDVKDKLYTRDIFGRD